jgi:hypothetical protein
MSYSPNGVAIFVGFETVTGSIDGNSGSFIIQHNGKFEDGVASSDFLIVADSGSEKLVGIAGMGTFKSGDNGQANYSITIAA